MNDFESEQSIIIEACSKGTNLNLRESPKAYQQNMFKNQSNIKCH